MIAHALNLCLMIVAAHGSYTTHDGATLIARTRAPQQTIEQNQLTATQKGALALRLRARLGGHTKPTVVVVFSPDGRTLATGSLDRTVKLWDAMTGKLQATFFAQKAERGYHVIFSPDGRILATHGFSDRTLSLWNTKTLQLMTKVVNEQSFYTIAFSPDGLTLLTGHKGKAAKLWDTQTGRLKATLQQGEPGQPGLKAFWKFMSTANPPRPDPYTSAQLSPDGRIAGTENGNGVPKLWDTTTGQLKTRLDGYDLTAPSGKCCSSGVGAGQLVFSPDNRTVAVVSGTAPYVYVQLRDAETGQLRATLIDEAARRTQEDMACSHLSFINSMSFSPDGHLLVTASSEGKTKLWTVATAKLNATLPNGGIVFKAIFSPDGAMLATLDNSGSDGEHTIKLWTVATGKLRAAMTVKGFTREFFSDRMFDIEEIAFSPDGSLLMTSSRKMVRLMDVKSGEVIGTLEEARSPATFSPDGKSLATTGMENSNVLLWEVLRPDSNIK